jgi:hypothetical protein
MGNNIVIATSSDLYDQMNSQIQEDQKLILSQIKEISRLTSENLKNSILYEGAKRESTNLKDEIRSLRAGVDRLKEIAFMHCEMFEQIYGTDGITFNYDKMSEYLDVAVLLETLYGRKTPYIKEIRDRMSRMRI